MEGWPIMDVFLIVNKAIDFRRISSLVGLMCKLDI